MSGRLVGAGSLLVILPLLAGCGLLEEITVTASGNIVSIEEKLAGFDRVEVGQAFVVDITQDDIFQVAIRIDENLVPYLDVFKRGRTLEIGLDLRGRSILGRATMAAEVTLPALTGLDLSGASQGTISGFGATETLDIDLSGASSLRGDIEAGVARFQVSGASFLTLRGLAHNVFVDASGASTVDLADLVVADAVVEASGASRVTVNPKRTLDVDSSGAARVF